MWEERSAVAVEEKDDGDGEAGGGERLARARMVW